MFIVEPLQFQQQTVKYLIKFEILVLTVGFSILKFLTSNGYIK